MTVLAQARDYFKSPEPAPLTVQDFAQRFRVGQSFAVKTLAKLRYEGIVERVQVGPRSYYRKVWMNTTTAARAARIAALVAQGVKLADAAKEVGITKSWACRLLRRQTPKPLQGPRKWDPAVWGARDAFIRENWGQKSSRQMGRDLGCRSDDIRERARMMGLDWGLLINASRQAKAAAALKRHEENRQERKRDRPKRNPEAEDPLVTDPMVRNIVTARDGAADVQRVLSMQPAFVSAWQAAA